MEGFQFKRFTVCHGKCAMKVGTDGVLLGAWAEGGRRILDIGTGSGLIALFMAQRYKDAQVAGIDIEHGACIQALENVQASPFSDRIRITETSLQDFESGTFDSIVCNPPFYSNSPDCKTVQRTMARSSKTLTATDLFRHASRLLSPNGVFSIVIPATHRSRFDAEAVFAGLYPHRVCGIKTTPRKTVGRYLIAYGKNHPNKTDTTEQCLSCGNKRSLWYSELTKDFYL